MNLVVAADRHWADGKDGRVLVDIPGDRQMLMKETLGKVLVMGRKTLESLPGGRPFASRRNLVLTRNGNYRVKGAQVCISLEEALKTLEEFDTRDVYIIGGQSMYEQFLPYADTVHVTRIDYTYDADSFFPNLEQDGDWEMTEEGEEQTYFDLCYTFQRFQRRKQQNNCKSRHLPK